MINERLYYLNNALVICGFSHELHCH